MDSNGPWVPLQGSTQAEPELTSQWECDCQRTRGRAGAHAGPELAFVPGRNRHKAGEKTVTCLHTVGAWSCLFIAMISLDLWTQTRVADEKKEVTQRKNETWRQGMEEGEKTWNRACRDRSQEGGTHRQWWTTLQHTTGQGKQARDIQTQRGEDWHEVRQHGTERIELRDVRTEWGNDTIYHHHTQNLQGGHWSNIQRPRRATPLRSGNGLKPETLGLRTIRPTKASAHLRRHLRRASLT
eukprot:6197286-Pleurochrysis_carterae.AAC.4